MKKIYGLFILAVSFFLFACNGLFLNSSLGKIVIQLPDSGSGNARQAIMANAENTSYYVIILEGPTSKLERVEGGSTVIIDELEPGEYTVTVEAYSKEGGYRVAYNSQTVSVKAGEIADVFLEMKKGWVANTGFTWWNYDSSNTQNPYSYTISAKTPNNGDNLEIKEDGEFYPRFSAASTDVIEDNDGYVYFVTYEEENGVSFYFLCRYDKDGTTNKVKLRSIGNADTGADKIYYDEKNDYIYLVSPLCKARS